MERIKVLTAALALREFTISELAAFSGVNIHTVRTVADRNKDIVEKLDPMSPAGPGRPAAKWRVRDSEETRRFAETLQTMTPAPPVASPLSVEDQYEAIVGVAENTIARIVNQRDPAMQRRTLRSAQSTLHMIDSDLKSDFADDAQPWWADGDSGVAIRASAVDALAALATSPERRLSDKTLSGVADKLAAAMEVEPEHGGAVYFAPLTQLLASRGVLPPLVMVAEEVPPGLDRGRWIELPVTNADMGARVLTQRWATPFVGVADSMPLVAVGVAADTGGLSPRTRELVTSWLERSRASARPALVVGDATQGDLLRLAARAGVPFVPMGWETAEDNQLGVEAVSSAVERQASQVNTVEHIAARVRELHGLLDDIGDDEFDPEALAADVPTARRLLGGRVRRAMAEYQQQEVGW